MTLESSSGRSTVSGVIRDQSEFQGLIRQLANLGLDVLSASALPNAGPPADVSTGAFRPLASARGTTRR